MPGWLRGKGRGWVTAEYGMLPRATHTRGDREAARGKQSGRTQEIQRLIGRSLRAVTNRAAMGEMTVTLHHEINNPLMAAFADVELLLEGDVVAVGGERGRTGSSEATIR